MPCGVDNCTSCLRASGAGGFLFLALCLTASGGRGAGRSSPRRIFHRASGYVGGGYAFGKAGLYEPGFRTANVGTYGRYR